MLSSSLQRLVAATLYPDGAESFEVTAPLKCVPAFSHLASLYPGSWDVIQGGGHCSVFQWKFHFCSDWTHGGSDLGTDQAVFWLCGVVQFWKCLHGCVSFELLTEVFLKCCLGRKGNLSYI